MLENEFLNFCVEYCSVSVTLGICETTRSALDHGFGYSIRLRVRCVTVKRFRKPNQKFRFNQNKRFNEEKQSKSRRKNKAVQLNGLH